MQALFIVFGIIGLIMIFFGAKWTWKSVKAKEIVNFPFIESKKEFEIKNIGLFSLCILGGGSVNNSGCFQVQIKDRDNQRIVELKENTMKPRFRKNWKMGVEYFQFKISKNGWYKIEIKNPKDLVVKQSTLKIKQVFQYPVPTESLEVLIKETIPNSKKLFGILLLVLGVNISAWGIMLGINPHLFG